MNGNREKGERCSARRWRMTPNCAPSELDVESLAGIGNRLRRRQEQDRRRRDSVAVIRRAGRRWPRDGEAIIAARQNRVARKLKLAVLASVSTDPSIRSQFCCIRNSLARVNPIGSRSFRANGRKRQVCPAEIDTLCCSARCRHTLRQGLQRCSVGHPWGVVAVFAIVGRRTLEGDVGWL